jgi:hypothetical protein
MSHGGGKYSDEAEALLKSTGAAGVLLIVFGDTGKAGFSVVINRELVDSNIVLRSIPGVLRKIADDVEKDIEIDVLGGHQGTS